jgi:hypothetical protein
LTWPLHTTPCVTLLAARPQLVGHCTFSEDQNGEQGGVAAHCTTGRGALHQLSAMIMTSPLMVPLHTTPSTVEEGSRPQ